MEDSETSCVGPEKVGGRSHFIHKLVGGDTAAKIGRVDLNCGLVDISDSSSHCFDYLDCKSNVADERYIFDHTFAFCENTCKNYGESGVFHSADCDLALQGIAAIYDNSIHKNL
ncbi:MAG: hypothetical protein IIV73_06625, partial [Bacteroidaceae bacterium]|nr:hypothetical protein [Bacteroidaceae bacterium]